MKRNPKKPLYMQDKNIRSALSLEQFKLLDIGFNLPEVSKEAEQCSQHICDLINQRNTLVRFATHLTMHPDHDIAIKIEDGDLPLDEAILRIPAGEYRKDLESIVNKHIESASTEIDEQCDRLKAIVNSIHSFTK